MPLLACGLPGGRLQAGRPAGLTPLFHYITMKRINSQQPASKGTPMTISGLSIEVFETTGPEQAGPPPHRHPWDEVYVVLDGTLEVFDGQSWRQAKAGACATVPANQVHAYRNGSPDCRFLTIAGPRHAREFFEQMDAEVTTLPPDMGAVLTVAARNGLEVITAG
jgi:quercetin dioxygenase-like cupin family protein